MADVHGADGGVRPRGRGAPGGVDRESDPRRRRRDRDRPRHGRRSRGPAPRASGAAGVVPGDVTTSCSATTIRTTTVTRALFPARARIHDVMATYRDDLWIERDAEGFHVSPAVRLLATPGHTLEDVTNLAETAAACGLHPPVVDGGGSRRRPVRAGIATSSGASASGCSRSPRPWSPATDRASRPAPPHLAEPCRRTVGLRDPRSATSSAVGAWCAGSIGDPCRARRSIHRRRRPSRAVGRVQSSLLIADPRADRRRGRHGRRRQRGLGRDTGDRRSRRRVRPGEHPADRPAARAPLRGELAVREGPGDPNGADRRRPHGPAAPEWAGGTIAPGALDIAPDQPGPARVAFRPARINRLLGTTLTADEQRALLARVGVATEAGAAGEPVVVAATRAARRSRPAGRGARRGRPHLAPRHRDRGGRRGGDRPGPRLRARARRSRPTPRCPIPPVAARGPRAVRETLAGAGLTEVVTTALVSPRHVETFVLRREVPSVGGEPGAGRRADRRPQPALARPLGAAPEPRRQPARRRRRQPPARHARRRGVRDRQGLRARRRRAARVVAPRDRARSARRSRPPGTAPPARMTWTTRRASSSCWPPGWAWRARLRGRARRAAVPPGRTARATHGGTAPGDRRRAPPGRRGRVGAADDGRGCSSPRSPSRGSAAGRLPPERRPVVGRYPEVERDLAVVVPESTPAAAVEALIRAHGGELLRGVALFDIYRGVPLAAARRASRSGSSSARLTGRSPRPRSSRRSVPSSPRWPPSRAGSGPDAVDRTIARRRTRTGTATGLPDRCDAGSAAATLRRGRGRPGHAAAVTRGIVVGHQRNAGFDQRRRHARRPVPVRDVHPGLRPGHRPPAHRHPVDHVLVLPRAPAQRLLAGRLPEHELDAVPERVLE